LSIDRKVGPDTDLKADYHLLDTIANIMADAIFAAYSAHEEREKLESESRALKLELENKLRPTEIIGNCSNMKKVYSMISKVAASNATVLIRGESGTGKELVAKAIQKNSSRADKPFIAVNCAALPEGLIESELFGHEKGSFTGAINRKIGLAELANIRNIVPRRNRRSIAAYAAETLALYTGAYILPSWRKRGTQG
ncbi:MAG: sigma 54-interacting transcriptional regulator, partial [Bacilli bacterium]